MKTKTKSPHSKRTALQRKPKPRAWPSLVAIATLASFVMLGFFWWSYYWPAQHRLSKNFATPLISVWVSAPSLFSLNEEETIRISIVNTDTGPISVTLSLELNGADAVSIEGEDMGKSNRLLSGTLQPGERAERKAIVFVPNDADGGEADNRARKVVITIRDHDATSMLNQQSLTIQASYFQLQKQTYTGLLTALIGVFGYCVKELFDIVKTFWGGRN